jgi:hypothetical protein
MLLMSVSELVRDLELGLLDAERFSELLRVELADEKR